MAEVVSD